MNTASFRISCRSLCPSSVSRGHAPVLAPRSVTSSKAFNLRLSHESIRNLATRRAVETEAETSPDIVEKPFNWFKHWWPVQLLYNLDTDRPNRIQLLGEYFVAWKSKSGEWVVMRDMCPHRLAPLSEGRIEEDGTLMCSYHGWRFNEGGKCVKIPQADDEKSREAACNNPRSCATTYPCKARGAILWIWPDHSETRFLEASVTSIGLPDKYADCMERRLSDGYRDGTSFDFPYGYAGLVENTVDQSHTPFAHHGIMPGVVREAGGPMSMEAIAPTGTNSVLAVEYIGWFGEKRKLELVDCSSAIFQVSRDGSYDDPLVIILLNVPVQISKSRLISFFISPGAQSGNKQTRQPLFLRIPGNFVWLLHINSMRIFSGDAVMLHAQDAYLKKRDLGESDTDAFFTPASSDLAVVQLRHWLHHRGGGGPFGRVKDETSTLLPREQLLDRYALHVSQCKLCQNGLRFVKQMISVSKFLSQICLVLIGAVVFQAMRLGTLSKWKAATATAAFIVFSFSERFLKTRLLPQFYFVDHVHAEKN